MTPTNWTPWEQLPDDGEAFLAVVVNLGEALIGTGVKNKTMIVINGRFAWDYEGVLCWMYLKDLVTLPTLPDDLQFKKEYKKCS